MNRPALSAGGRRVLQRVPFFRQFPAFSGNVPLDVPQIVRGTSEECPVSTHCDYTAGITC